jgi:hypothetical protein
MLIKMYTHRQYESRLILTKLLKNLEQTSGEKCVLQVLQVSPANHHFNSTAPPILNLDAEQR